MKISALTARNVKNLELANVPFRELTLVHGPNGVGKSNLLHVLHTLLSRKGVPEEIGGEVKFPIEGLIADPDFLRRKRTSATASLTLDCYSQDFKKLAKLFPNARRAPSGPIPQQVTIDFAITEYSGGARFSISEIRIGNKMIYQPKLNPPLSAQQQKSLEDWIARDVEKSTVYIPSNRIHRRDPVPLDLRSRAAVVDNLENTVLRLLTSRDEDSAILDRVKKTMRDFFGITDIRSEIRVVPRISADGSNEQLSVGVRLQERSGEWFDLERVGTGIQQILVIVCMIHMTRSKIILLEEFDASLSPRKRSQLLQQLKELLGPGKPLRQVIATSHTTFEPRQQNVVSLGASKCPNGGMNFEAWGDRDWRRFSARDE